MPTVTKSRPAPPQTGPSDALANIRTLRKAAASAAALVPAHHGEVLRAITRLHGSTYVARGDIPLTVRGWQGVNDVQVAAPGISTLEADIAASRVASDAAALARLRQERGDCQEVLASATVVDTGLRARAGEAMGAYHAAVAEHLAAVRAAAYEPVEVARARLARLEAEAEAKIAAAAAELES